MTRPASPPPAGTHTKDQLPPRSLSSPRSPSLLRSPSVRRSGSPTSSAWRTKSPSLVKSAPSVRVTDVVRASSVMKSLSPEPVATAATIVRAGTLNQEQLRELHDQQAIWDEWVMDKARQWKVNPITIMTNMGADHREQRMTSFWNKFQAVFWDEIGNTDWEEIKREQEVKKSGKSKDQSGDTEEALMPKSKLEILKDRCSEEYARLEQLTKGVEMPGDERNKLIKEKKRIEARYVDLHDPEKLVYREGDTHKLIRQARKEFTTRAMYYWSRGLAIFGAIASCDPVDPTASALNIMFAGSDAARKYLDSQRGNLRVLLRDFETFCRTEEQDARKRSELSLGQLYRAHKDNNGQRRTEIANLLKNMWAKAMDVEIPYAVPWDRWPADMESLQSCLDGWPDEVPWPGGPKAYKALEASKVTTALWPYICNQKEKEVKIVKWSDDQIVLCKQLSLSELVSSEEYTSICLVRGASGKPLLTIGQIGEQSLTRLEDKRAIKRREAARIDDNAVPRVGKSKRKAKADPADPAETLTNGTKDQLTRKKARILDTQITKKVDVRAAAQASKEARLKGKKDRPPMTKCWVSDDEKELQGEVGEGVSIPHAKQAQAEPGPSTSTAQTNTVIPANVVVPESQPLQSQGGMNMDMSTFNLAGLPNIQQLINAAIQTQLRQALDQQHNGMHATIPPANPLGQQMNLQRHQGLHGNVQNALQFASGGMQMTHGHNGLGMPAMTNTPGLDFPSLLPGDGFGVGHDFLNHQSGSGNWGPN
ncbi:hypothetical protein M422DRAFT_32442 [Sphaerobolus stellatus SS14]|uniref:Uncharacterized protein n=1 Tax=Sphaerobolus stellatus (strain SS14) TaxID=990650 RepID=A0A0C9VF65_SPHS4|nr:hypothetical protein M422DRAFT_32442 [Sphaerobolus stellatus SS14]